LIRGVISADTAEDLMRSRYSAFALSEWDYLEQTLHPTERSIETDKSHFKRKETVWTRLEIIRTNGGSSSDIEGEVTFAAYFQKNGKSGVLREQSKFLRQDGKWFYSQRLSKAIANHTKKNSITPPQTFRRDTQKVGRNDPCPCGSGKKFKKCCNKR
tara:strand:- start:1690 stop:2160 length:471 start_codon:yes stop_codon:yes gene_type:complete